MRLFGTRHELLLAAIRRSQLMAGNVLSTRVGRAAPRRHRVAGVLAGRLTGPCTLPLSTGFGSSFVSSPKRHLQRPSLVRSSRPWTRPPYPHRGGHLAALGPCSLFCFLHVAGIPGAEPFGDDVTGAAIAQQAQVKTRSSAPR